MIDNSDYPKRLESFKQHMLEFTSQNDWRLEFVFESLSDECLFGDVDQTREWYQRMVAENTMSFEPIALADCRQWSMCPETGSMVHDSGEFFRVDGIRIQTSPTREVVGGWDQPILTQIGYDGGILGLMRKRFSGVPHYLVEAKAEPGNYNVVQITTTIQATFSNLKRAHQGKSTPYSEFFTDTHNNGASIIFSIWMSEDGGRLLNKRNLTMLIEVPEHLDVPLINSSYRWVSLYQIKNLLLLEEAIVAPHIRGVLSIV
jgi:oxidase EvaA